VRRPALTSRSQFLALLLITLSACSWKNSGKPGESTQEVVNLPSLKPLQPPHTPYGWGKYQVVRDGRAIDAYLVHDDKPKPVVVLIQGSGCAPIMTQEADGALNDTSLFQELVATRSKDLHFALVEKQGVDLLRFSGSMSREQKLAAFKRATDACGQEFMQKATKQNRVSDVLAMVRALRRQPWVSNILLAGHSEGTQVAAGLVHAAEPKEIAAAGLLASAGPTQFFKAYLDGNAKGRATTSDSNRLRALVDTIRTLQSSDDDFEYEGWPARRWKTYAIESTPLEDIRSSDVPLFVAQGTEDGSTIAADLFVLEAVRQRRSRPVRYVVVAKGDHGFDTPTGTRLPALFDDFVRWSLDPAKKTGVEELQ
jgi:pimeloyl-ACP methyl ester carboxylesterase